jgi:glucose/arabinose dehydrogenase
MVRALLFAALLVAAVSTSRTAANAAGADDIVAHLSLPDGFAIEVYAEVPKARSLVVAPELGVVFVGSRGRTVHAIVDADMDGRAESVTVAADGLRVPNGLAWRDGRLYVAEQHRVVRYRFPDRAALGRVAPEVVFDGLPDKRWHGWRYAAFGTDGGLYVAVGAPCNVCRISGLEGSIVRLDVSSGDAAVYARGIRNSVGIDFQPGTGTMYFTDNGADHMGDDSPPDELNRAETAGLHFGYPWYGGGGDRTAEFRGRTPPDGVRFPEVAFNAHVAALGIHFYRGTGFPDEYRRDAFVAQHGSWNRSIPIGYRVMRVRFGADGRAGGAEPFIEGWLRDDRGVLGRPVDVAELPDGSLLVSDDYAGVVYRVSYRR